MKKITLLFLFLSVFSINAQTDYVASLPVLSATQVRGPQGTNRYQKAVWVITAAEMASAGFVNGDIFNALAFNFSEGLDIPTTGTLIAYLQNTTAVTNTKSTIWATTITGMSVNFNGSVTLPATIGQFTIPFSTNFTYTGGGVFVAYEYQNPTSAIATVPSSIPSNTSLAAATRSYASATVNGTTLTGTSVHRPVTIFGKLVACARPVDVAVPTTTANSSTITFSASDPANLEYGAYDFVPGTAAGSTLTSVTSPHNIAGLPPSSAFEVYAKTNCGSFVGLSTAAAPVSFHTTYFPADPDYTTSFEIDNFPNIGWLEDVETNGSEWFTNFGGTGSVLVQNGLYSAVSLSNTTATADARMYSRGVNLQAGSPATVSFYTRNYQATSTNNASFVITAGTAQTAAAQTIPIGTDTALSSATFVLKSYTFVPPTTGVYYIGFLHNSPINATGTHGIIVDNFTVSQALATDQFLDSKFATYPNPAKNVINVTNSTDALLSTIEMSDINGKIVKNIKLSDVSEAQITVSDLSTGIYTMKITSDKGVVTKKIIKE
jgi:Secretion system C-terminal sorting domain